MITYIGRIVGKRGLGKIASWETRFGWSSIIGGHKGQHESRGAQTRGQSKDSKASCLFKKIAKGYS